MGGKLAVGVVAVPVKFFTGLLDGIYVDGGIGEVFQVVSSLGSGPHILYGLTREIGILNSVGFL